MKPEIKLTKDIVLSLSDNPAWKVIEDWIGYQRDYYLNSLIYGTTQNKDEIIGIIKGLDYIPNKIKEYKEYEKKHKDE